MNKLSFSYLFYLLKKIFRILFLLVVVFVFLMALLIGTLQLPPVQLFAVRNVTKFLNDKIRYPIDLQGISIGWLGQISLHDVAVKDKNKLEMIKIEELELRFNIPSLLLKNKTISSATLNRLILKLEYDSKLKDVNIGDFIYSLEHIGDIPNAPKPPPYDIRIKRAEFKIKNIKINNAYVSFNDSEVDKLNDRFQFPHFAFDSIFLDVKNFKVVKDTFSFKIMSLNAVDQFAKLRIKDLKADYSMCPSFLKLEDLNGKLGKTIISDTVIMKFNKYSSLANFNDSVKLKMNFKNAVIYPEDIAVFVPSIRGFNDVWTLNGGFRGKVKNFRFQNMDIGFGRSSFVRTSGRFKGFPNWDSTFIDAQIHDAQLYAKDLQNYGLQGAKTQLTRFHRTKLKGKFRGYPSDFEAYGDFKTALGNFDINLKLQTPNQKQIGKYFAEINTKDFKLGEALADEAVGEVSAHLFLNGKGFEKQNADFTSYGVIDKIQFQGMKFHNTILRSGFKNQILHASLDIKDSNVVADGTLMMNLTQNKETSSLHTDVRKLNLNYFKITDKPVFLTSEIDLNTYGWGWGNLGGEVDFNDLILKDDKNNQVLYKSTQCKYHRDQEKSYFEIKSDAFDTKIDGEFNFQNLATHIVDFKEAIKVAWQNDKAQKTQFYSRPNLPGGIDINFKFKNKNINPLLAIFLNEYRISENASCSGNYASGHNHDLKIEGYIDTLIKNNITLINNSFKSNILKGKRTHTLISQSIFSSEKQKINDVANFENLHLNLSWINENLTFGSTIKQQDETNEARINGTAKILDLGKEIAFNNSFVKLLDKDWVIDSTNKIYYASNLIDFKNVQFKNENQRIAIEGSFSEGEDKIANVLVENFKLENFNKLLGISLFGNLNSKMFIKNIYKQPDIKSELSIDNLRIKKFDVGSVNGATNWDLINKKLLMNLSVAKAGESFFTVFGYYKPDETEKEKKLNLLANLNNTNLHIFEPFVGEIISEISGLATGNVSITGNLTKPLLNGNIAIKKGGFKVNYLNTYHEFSDNIHVTPSKFELQNVKMYDTKNNLALVNAQFLHNNFQDLNMKIGGNFTNYELLNTLYTDTSTYYGYALASGDFDISGNMKELKINVNATSDKETSIKIPLNNGTSVEKKEFITFTSKNKTENKKIKKQLKVKKSELLITMDFNFDFTPDAYLEIQLDQVSGDKISGYGNGKINMKINTDGDFFINGNFIFEKESNYYFTFLNTVSKKFNIQKGSNIVFTGNPYEAQIDVKASYDDRVPLYPIITDTSAWRKAGIRTPYPVSTILFLKNDLMKPTISYDIKIKDYPAVVSGVPVFNYVSAFENLIKNNENEMNNQVFGLLVFRRLLSTEQIGVGNAVGGTVSELLSNQLSSLVSQLDQNLNVDLNVNGLNRDALNNMQLRVSYTLMEGKIRVTRSSGLTNTNNQSATANAIGEWTVEYMLTDDGKFRLKGFNRNNPNVLATSNNNSSNTSAGVSVMHTTSFNSLNPFKKKKKRKK